jgi:two-component system, OmpR family, response regulator
LHKILIVDDEEQNRELAQIVLRKEGYELVFAQDGLEALARIKEEHFVLLILDLMMPNMGGFALIEALKEQDIEIKTLIVSALSDEENKRKAFALGADAYIDKPYDIFTLKHEVRQILSPEEVCAEDRVLKLARFLEGLDKELPREALAQFCKDYLLLKVDSFRGLKI